MPEQNSAAPTATLPASLPVILEMLSIDTTSNRSNKQLVDLIAVRAREAGAMIQRQSSPCGNKENIVVTIPDVHGRTTGGVMLSGHIDTVPVDGQDWSSNPFNAEIREGRLFARGASDMKTFCGAVLAALPGFAAAKLSEPIHMAFTYDEETGCAGARQLVEAFHEFELSPRLCIVGEPTSMQIVDGHKGCLRSTLTVRGLSAHSSLAPNGVNAVQYAGRAVAFLADLADRFREEGPFDPSFTIPHTTVSVGRIAGGSEPNIVPDMCTVEFEIRPVPGHDITALDEEIATYFDTLAESMQAISAATGLSTIRTVNAPPLVPAQDNQAVALLSGLASIAQSATRVSYGTEAGVFDAAGIDSAVCGPGSIEQAHIADEFIDLEQIVECERFLESLLTTLVVA